MTNEEANAWIEERVSRETMARLTIYHSLLMQWQKTINLVAPSTLQTAWSRHFADSVQIFDCATGKIKNWLDLGSGAGFPGLVVAAMVKDTHPDLKVTLVESDVRKCGFLREAARQMQVNAIIIPKRIAEVLPQSADVISARALSNLKNLFEYAAPHMTSSTCLLFPKGNSYKTELDTLPSEWQIKAEILASLTDPDAVIIRFQNNLPGREF